MDDIDAVLSSLLKRIAAPGDAAGVADAIRARVDAGDTGTPATSSGFGSGVAAWLPWVGLIVVAGLVGGALGPLGVLGAQHTEALVAAPTGVLIETTPAYLCAGGATVGTLFAGERVLTVERSDDSSWLGVRNPDSLVGTIWLPASVVTVDAGQDAAALPTGGACPVITASVDVAPVTGPVPAPGPVPGPGPGPAPTPDTTAPSISVGSFSPQPVYGIEAAPYCATQSNVTVTATDNIGIASVSGSANTAGASLQLVSSSGSTYVFTFSAPYSSGPNKVVTATFTATDTSGNQVSAPRTLVLTASGNCLI